MLHESHSIVTSRANVSGTNRQASSEKRGINLAPHAVLVSLSACELRNHWHRRCRVFPHPDGQCQNNWNEDNCGSCHNHSGTAPATGNDNGNQQGKKYHLPCGVGVVMIPTARARRRTNQRLAMLAPGKGARWLRCLRPRLTKRQAAKAAR
jgi:hypothetical protein